MASLSYVPTYVLSEARYRPKNIVRGLTSMPVTETQRL